MSRDSVALRTSEGSPLTIARVDRRMSDLEEPAAYPLADLVLGLYDLGYSSAVIARAHSMGKPVVLTDVGDLSQQALPDDVVLPVDYSSERCARPSAGASKPIDSRPPIGAWRPGASMQKR